MRWIKKFQLFLFDFDGLLVNTEEIHYNAYRRMCAKRGFDLDLSFDDYCCIAHYNATGMQQKIYEQQPQLLKEGVAWEQLYQEKKQAVIDLFHEGAVHLMPGVEKLLTNLENNSIPRCVVTHSAEELIKVIRNQHAIFDTIPNWITRGDYSQPKPHPECYLKAIDRLAKPEDRVIGFEDSPRGLKALLGTRAKPVLISTMDYPEIPAFIAQGATHYTSFEAIPIDWE